MSSRLLSLATAGVVALALAGCATGSDSGSDAEATGDGDLVSLAQEEGQVVVYTGWRDESIAAVKEAFEAEYGIEVIIDERFSSAALGQRIDADIRSSGQINADFVLTTDQALASYLYEEGLSKPVSADSFPGVTEDFVQGEASVGCAVGVPVVGYNKDVLGADFEIDSWDDLLDPALNGQIMIADPRNSAAWGNTWSAIYNDPTLGEDFLADIAATGFQPVASSLVGTEQLIAGQGGVLMFGIPSLFEPAMEAGQSIDFWYPADPAPVFFNFCLLPENSENPNAGELFLQWIMSEEGQQVANEIERLASPLGEVPGLIPLPENFTEAPAPYKVQQDMPNMVEILGFS